MEKPFDHVLEYVDDYFHDVLTPAEDAYIEKHCEQCKICKVGLEEAEKRLTAFQSVPASEASEPLIQATLKKVDDCTTIQARRRRLLRRGALAGLAAALLLLATLHIYYLNLSPSPYDLTLFGQAQLLAGTDGSLRVRVLDHNQGAGLEGVPVTIELYGQDQVVRLASFNTDAGGTGKPRFRLPDWPDGDYEMRVTAQPGGTTETITRTIKLKRAWKLMLSSDRPVYQPGQEIHVRALALGRLNLKPAAGHKAVFTISDPKGNVIFKQKDVTSKFGISAADCPLATEVLEGTYTIGCEVGDTASKLAVEVKRYVLPKFKITLTPDQTYYQPGQRVRGKLKADYFFGKPVAGGKVELELVATSGPLVAENSKEPKTLYYLDLRTNDKGEAAFEFPALAPFPADKEGIAQIEIRATVTDTAGQKQSRKSSLAVAAQPLRIEVIPEAGSLVRGLPNIVYLYVSTPDGQPARARVAITGVGKELETSDLGVTSFEFTPHADEVAWTIKATDGKGRSSRREVELKCGRIGNDFLVRPDRAVYNGGDTMRLVALGGGNEPIFVDLIKDGQTMLTDTFTMDNGRSEVHLDLSPELFGTVELCAYRFGKETLPVRKTRVVYIRPPSQLSIRSTLDKREYRPGGRARLQFALIGQNGNPTPGALSLAVVDEAVFSVRDERTGMQEFYTLDEGLLQPIYALYPWSPSLSIPGKPEERNRLEQALFARAKRPPSDRNALLQQLLPFVENDKRVFDVLENPNWQTLIRPDLFPEETLSLLRNEDSRHTLKASTVPDSVRRTEAEKKFVLTVAKCIWIGLGILGAVLFLCFFAILLKKTSNPGVFILIPTILLLVCCLIPPERNWLWSPFVKIREASMRTQQLNDLTQIGLAIHSFRDVYKNLPGQISSIDGSTSPRIRDWFPETLLWRPELITDDQGRANLDLDLADSITSWRLTASAVTADGRLGATKTGIKVFQPFFVDVNLPVALTRNDELAVPVVLYNYLDKSQLVELKLDNAAWFKLLDEPARRIELKPREVRSTHYRLRVVKVGMHDMQVTAIGSGVSDAVKRKIEVVSDGRRVESVWNGQFPAHRVSPAPQVQFNLALPKNAIEGSPRLFVKIYPSTFSQLVEGLDAIFQLPYGCFEQTSSTTYPNVLALDYLRRTKKSVPAVEAKARQYIHLGYQRLLGFEVKGGGFDWFGNPPANRTLTAYGLMEFEDMARVHDVDPNLIERTRKWLFDQRQTDGSWKAEGHVPQSLPGGHDGTALARLSTTAYIAWAVFRDKKSSADSQPTRAFLLAHRPDTIRDPHALALIANALLAIDPAGQDARPYLDRLEALKMTSRDGKLAWWQQISGGRTTFYGAGRAGNVETTALAALALIHSRYNPASAAGALAWLTQQKDASGAWPSTQATVLALKAFLAGTGQLLGQGERRIELTLNDGKKRILAIPADQAEVMKLVDLSPELTAGESTLILAESTGTAAGYQVTFRYHEPGESQRPKEPLSIQVTYEQKKLRVGDTLPATASVANRLKETASMVLVELPIPAGFTVKADDFERLVEDRVIAKYQVTPRAVQVYLRDLPAAKKLELRYGLRAEMPVDIRVPAARVYEYYDPDRQGFSATLRLTVTQ